MYKAARDDSYNSLKTAEQKAKANKLLSQTSPKGGTGRPANLVIVVVKIGVDDRLSLATLLRVWDLRHAQSMLHGQPAKSLPPIVGLS
jgi:hypothetical protein